MNQMDKVEYAAPVLNYETLNAIDRHLEALYESKATMQAGQKMVGVKLQHSQIRGLENLVMSTRRFSEIINYIKRQTGKDKTGMWPQIAETLLDQLDKLEQIAKEIGQDDAGIIIEVKKKLARGWVKQIVAHYMFAGLKRGKIEP